MRPLPSPYFNVYSSSNNLQFGSEMSRRFKRTGILCVVSGPSGSGKTTLCRNLAQRPGFVFSISCTTRPPRKGEINGIDYYFLAEDEFRDRIRRKQFLEYAKVHGHYYGTLHSTVTGLLKEGTDVLLDLDVQGARKIRKIRNQAIRKSLVDVFIMPPTLKDLHQRLIGRGDTDPEELQRRIEVAQEEMQQWREYNYLLLSDTPQKDRAAFEAILGAERLKSSRLRLPGARI